MDCIDYLEESNMLVFFSEFKLPENLYLDAKHTKHCQNNGKTNLFASLHNSTNVTKPRDLS